MTDADYADDLVLLENKPGQVEGIGLYVNANKTEYMCFKQKGAITTKWQACKINEPVHIPQ